MSRGAAALMGGLAALTAALILLSALFLALFRIAPEGSESLSPVEAAWSGLMHAMDAGALGGDSGWGFRLVMLVVTLGGIFIFSALIGVINSGLEARMEELRKGRSRVIERDHIAILGWSSQIFPILSELSIANEDRPGACVVILGDLDKVEMEDRVREKMGSSKLRVVCRSGSPIDMDDLQITSLQTCRAVIVLSDEGSENPDADVIKVLLAVTNHPQRRPAPYHIVAEMQDSRNAAVAQMVGKDELEIVQIGTLIARITAQTCRQSGLSVVYTELLDFQGDEIYLKEEPGLVGKRYEEALTAYPTCAVIGYMPAGGTPQLNPPMDTLFQRGDKVVLVAQDDSAIRFAPLPPAPALTLPPELPASQTPERTLVLGWNWRVPMVLSELDRYVPYGSTAEVVTDFEDALVALAARCSGLQNLRHTLTRGDTTDRAVLEERLSEPPDHVIVVSPDGVSVQGADARTLITLLHLRDISAQRQMSFSIVSEMRDLRNRALAEATRADDFIISDRLLSLMMTQIAETKALNQIFADLFSPDGAEVYLKPAAAYVPLGVELTFQQVVAAAAARGETAFGYRLLAQSRDPGANYGVRINPPKGDKLRFSDTDRVIVMADS